MTTKPTSEEARVAVNIFASIDVLGLLSDPDYPGAGTIEDAIKNYYNGLSSIPKSLRDLGMGTSLQEWNTQKEKYEFSGIWNTIVNMADGKHKVFASTSGTKTLLNKYVRLIANKGDTQGWKLAVNGSDLVTIGTQQYLTEAFNLSVKAYPGQWLRWWGNSITPFSALQCVIGNITNENRPQGLTQLLHQQDGSVTYNYPSGAIDATSYHTASSVAFSHLGQLKSDSTVSVGQKIQYDIQFKLVDPEGDVIASFQVDPEISVIERPA